MTKEQNKSWKEFEAKIYEVKASLSDKKKISKEAIEKELRQRAQRLSKISATEKEEKDAIFILEFKIGDENYGLPAVHLQEIVNPEHITTIPCTPPFLEGVLNVRGKILSIVNLKRYLKLDYPDTEGNHPVIIVSHRDILLGLLVDQLIDIVEIEKVDIQENFMELKKIKPAYVDGISKKTTIILNLENIVSDEELLVF